MSETYGKRTCLQCGEEFEAGYPAQLTCSKKCALERRREQDRRSDALAKARNKNLLTALDETWAELEWLNCRYEARRGEPGALMMAMCAAHAMEMKKLKAELTAAHDELSAMRMASLQAKEPLKRTVEYPTKRPAPVVDTNEWDYCEHLRLRAPKLPCGEREECKRCKRTRPLVLEPGDKVCAKCKQAFTPKSPTQKYCSKKCQEDAARAKIYGRKK